MRTINSEITELSESSNINSNMSGRWRRVSTIVRFSFGCTVGSKSIELTDTVGTTVADRAVGSGVSDTSGHRLPTISWAVGRYTVSPGLTRKGSSMLLASATPRHRPGVP